MSKAPSSAELAMPSEASFAGLDVAMAFRDARLHTYLCKDNPWPFTEDCKCTPEKMADAGFYFIGTEKEPDLVRCYWCRKEMDGWEPQDDPMAEHRRSEGCPFIKLGKPCPKLVFDDMLKLETVRGKFLAQKIMEKKKESFLVTAEESRQRMENVEKKKAKKGRTKRKRN